MITSTGLEYFKNIYDVVPQWVQKMYDYNPAILDHYTNLRSEAMKAGSLSVKEKDTLLVGMNAARLYERSMVYHTKGAIDGGLTLPELVEYLLVSYLYNNEKALLVSVKSFDYALELLGIEKTTKILKSDSALDIISYYKSYLKQEERSYIEKIEELLKANDENALSKKLLENGFVSSQLKHALMVGIYTTVLQNQPVETWTVKARNIGVSEEQLAEVGYICLLTAGIPAWFEISDSLVQK
ncbi:carboxymuconolactone decarboxylase family protein [Rummeliibacillus sp. JY-2-4R]